MTDAPKLLTEAEWRRLLAPYGAEEAIQYLGERGLIADEPVDPLLDEAREIAAHTRRNFRGHYAACHVADKIEAGEWDDHMLVVASLAALKRGLELAQPTLTRERLREALAKSGWAVWYSDLEIDRIHAALTKGTDHA